MDLIEIKILPVLILLAIIFIYLIRKENRKEKSRSKLKADYERERREAELEEKRRVEESERLRKLLKVQQENELYTEAFLPKLKLIQKANESFQLFTNSQALFFSNNNLLSWKNLFLNLYNDVIQISINKLLLNTGQILSISKFKNNFIEGENYRKKYNESFVEKELNLYSDFFDNIDGKKLDEQQRKSIIINEDNNLVIAGAGTGKTTTIIGKVNYIKDRYKVNSDEILLISFTSASANALKNKITDNNIHIKTFHKFGLDVITHCSSKPSIFESEHFGAFIKRFFTELCQDTFYLDSVTLFFNSYLKRPKTQFEFENQGEYIQYLKDQNFRTYKNITIISEGRTTLRQEIVKSIEECQIANYLLFNGIEYEYELPYEHETANESFRQYRPDFTIKQNGITIYLEHFALNRQGQVPSWFKGDANMTSSEKYNNGVAWKRQLHKIHKTELIESYSYEMKEGNLFEKLKDKLEDKGIILNPMSSKDIWILINDFANDEVKSFIELIKSFINLTKSNNYKLKDIELKISKLDDVFEKKRSSLFLEIIIPILDNYESYLNSRYEIDFSDMINLASNYIKIKQYNKKFKYVIIDEFQDLSVGRFELLKAIKASSPDCIFFCVGDDWQSIYRFTGSDLLLFNKFEEFFGYTVKSKIETTYRFKEPLIGLSSKFVLKNPNQSRKLISQGPNFGQTNYEIVYTEKKRISANLTKILNSICQIEDISTKEVIILGRYNSDIKNIENIANILSVDLVDKIITFSNFETSIKIRFMSVHKSKGLEADIIFILNCNSGKMGFPSELSDDNILNLLLSKSDQYENGEERRVFYVAMTRAKEKVFFFTDETYKSKFILEMETEIMEYEGKKCPECLTADLVLKKEGIASNGNTYKFYGCSNFLYGCNYTRNDFERPPNYINN